MAAVAERLESMVSLFEAFRLDARFGPAPQARERERAFERFLARGFPTIRDEEWKFTNVTPVAETNFVRGAALVIAKGALTPYVLADTCQIVLVNGRLAPSLSTLDALPAGVTIGSLRESPAASGDLADGRDPLAGGHAFVDLNTAFFEEGTVLTIAPQTVVTTPVHVLCVSASVDVPVMASPRLRIDVGEQAEVSIIESYAGIGPSPALTNSVTDVRLAASAIVRHVKLQREPATAFHLASSFIHLSRASTFTSCTVTVGGRIARNDIRATLDGEGAECTLNGLYVANGETLVDTHTIIDHAKPHCPSHEVYKGILAGRARAVFNGKIVVQIDAQKTDAKQTNKALLLSGDAQINTKPQLEIFADDVKCTHGAAIGQLDEDAMFYLRARGIAETDARNLLIHAFAGEVLDGITVESARACATRLIEEKLGVSAVDMSPS
jgi:Fe-S cluster assembly protein SufD